MVVVRVTSHRRCLLPQVTRVAPSSSHDPISPKRLCPNNMVLISGTVQLFYSVTRGERMAADLRIYWRRLAGKRQLTEIGLLGILFLVGAHSISSEPWNDLLVELGIAFVIASLLGYIVDEQLKRGLVEDAVSASIGYLLPDPLKNELKWVYDQKF